MATTTTNEVKFTVISDTAVKVQAKRELIDALLRPNDRYHGGTPEVTRNGCWVLRGKGGWVTISGFGGDSEAVMADLVELESATAKAL